MTIEETLKDMLIQSGMFENQADAVMEIVKSSKITEAMSGRWGDDMEGYPVELLSSLWVSTKRIALEYIDANMPMAWFRPMFSGEIPYKE